MPAAKSNQNLKSARIKTYMIQNKPFYKTEFGEAHLGDAMQLLKATPSESVDLIVTSPPFALQTPKAYGNEKQDKYVDWLLAYADEVKRVLKPTGSFVLDLGCVYEKGRPVRNLYNYRVLIKMCDEFDWNLAEEFFWHNPSKLASPAEWVNKRKIRAKDSVNTVWWFSKTDFPKADTNKVLNAYSERMKKLLDNGTKYYTPKLRPSGHDISEGFNTDNGGALPSNLLPIPNSDSNSKYFRFCRAAGVTSHPARFPLELPEFFIKFLTDEGDVVLDIFAGSNTTGAAAQALNRKWIAFELNQEYLAASVMRFCEEEKEATQAYGKLLKKPRHSTAKRAQKKSKQTEEAPTLDGLQVAYAQ